MWKITALAIRESPVQGVGLGGFPAAYAQAQMDYFKSGIGSETEKQVAGSPEYAFNEYLRIFLEQGVLGGILFLLLTVFIIRSGIRNKQIGASGSFFNIIRFCLCLLSLLFMGISGNVGTAWLGLRFKNRESSSKEKKQSETFIILFYF